MNTINLNGNCRLGIVDDQFVPETLEIKSLSELQIPEAQIITGTIPNNFELDMEKAGLLPDLYVGENLLKAQELEMMHLYYSRTFSVEDICSFSNPWFVFEGIDTFADIYLNGVKIGSTDNMLMIHRIRAEGLRQGENELFVHITPVALKAREYEYPMGTFGQKYNFDNIQVRKANYMAGWDIFPRIMSGGIWRGVSLMEVPQVRFLQNYLFTNRLGEDLKWAELCLFYEIDFARERYSDYTVRVEGTCGSSYFEKEDRVWSKSGRLNFVVENPEIWWPRGSGEQKLYDVTLTLLKNGEPVEVKKFRTGIRRVELDRTSITDENGNGEFCFKVNYRKIFIMGTNWVPLDSFPSQGHGKIEKALELVEDIGCNMIRVWGGGYYEEDLFYDLCDEKGFLIWHDFMMGCAIYPQDKPFLDRLEKEIVQQVQRLRQHTSIAIWAGDNECDCACEWAGSHMDPNDNVVTRQLLPRIIRSHDWVRPFLPSSPYRDEIAVQKGLWRVTEDHLWGPRDYYKGDFYVNALAHFASETGYHGCPSVKSLRKFLTEDALWPYENNGQWLLHASSPTESMDEPYAYRIGLMANQIKVLFGAIPDNLEEFSKLSQISQAEAMKFFVERFRIGKWRRTGIIWWNILDGCPQFSDAVVDYYFDKKLAYYYIKQSQQPVCLMFKEPENGAISLMAANDTMEDRILSYEVTDLRNGSVKTAGIVCAEADSSQVVVNLPEEENFTIWKIQWQMDGKTYRNHYVCGDAPYDKELYLKLIQKMGWDFV